MAEALKDGRPIAWRAHKGFQRRAMKCVIRELLIGGAKGSGKTALIGPKALKHVLKYGHLGAVVLILRETFGDLSELAEKVRPLFRRAGGREVKSEHVWRFPNGGRIKFGHLQDGCDRYWGHEYTLIIIDELTRCIRTEADYLKLLGSLRTGEGVPTQCMSASNPGGPGHVWVQNRFMSVPPMQVHHDRQGLARVFLPGRLEDNPTLDPIDPETGERTGEYRKSLESWPEAERRAYLDGDWDAFTGQVFKLTPAHKWSREKFAAHVAGQDLGKDGVPKAWTRYRFMDWGFAHPYCVLWVAVDYDGRAWVYRELYGVKEKPDGTIEPNVGVEEDGSEVARAIKAIEEETGEKIAVSYSGPDLWHRKARQMGDTRQFVSWFEEEGVWWEPWDAAPGTRLAGKMALHERLKVEEASGLPGLVILHEAAPHLVRTLPTLTYDEHTPELVSKKGEDHAYDTIKAFCLLYEWKPKRKDREDPYPRRGERRAVGGGTWQAG